MTWNEPLPESRYRLQGDAGGSILCVEDNEEMRMVLFEVLTSEGYEVTTAGTVCEGLDALEHAGTFELIVTDYSLPDGTGTCMLQMARQRGHVDETTPVVLFTGELRPCATAGMTLIRKPLLPDALVATVRALLERNAPNAAHDRAPR